MYLSAYVVQIIRILFIVWTLLTISSCGNKHLLEEVKSIPSYPSASGIEFLENKIYLIGDDAKNIMMLDSSYNSIDSIALYAYSEARIPKAEKADLESITTTKNNKLLLLGSGSLSPYRNVAWLIDPRMKEKEFIRLDTFYQRLQLNGLKELNIEGSCSIPGSVLLSNRGSKGYPKNYLIVTNDMFWTDQSDSHIAIISIGGNNDTTKFSGISGMTYAQKSDRLLLTVSTEDTKNAIDDGAIGKSYLWIIKNISSKKRWKAINPDKVIDLENMDARFKGQKIESVCITKETTGFLHLILVSDNDNGSSTIFRLVVEKD